MLQTCDFPSFAVSSKRTDMQYIRHPISYLLLAESTFMTEAQTRKAHACVHTHTHTHTLPQVTLNLCTHDYGELERSFLGDPLAIKLTLQMNPEHKIT